MDKVLLSVDDAAEVLSVSDWTIKKLLASGDLRSVKIRHRRLIPREAITELIERRLTCMSAAAE